MVRIHTQEKSVLYCDNVGLFTASRSHLHVFYPLLYPSTLLVRYKIIVIPPIFFFTLTAAMPHLTVDPIVTASSIVMNLQTLVSRRLSPLESGVCSITKFDAGDAFNIIPHSALLRGTIRALTTETLMSLRDKVQHVVESTATVYGCNVTITYSPDLYPPTVNDIELFESFSKDVAALVAEDGKLMDIEPTMGAEGTWFRTTIFFWWAFPGS